ncbi:MAG: hypothetical protein R3B99_28740 [Polyangiales bacterium]
MSTSIVLHRLRELRRRLPSTSFAFFGPADLAGDEEHLAEALKAR